MAMGGEWFEGLDQQLLEYVTAEDLDQESLYQLILDGAHSGQTRGAKTFTPSRYSHGHNSRSETTWGNTDIDADIAFDEALAWQLHEIDLSTETHPNGHNVISNPLLSSFSENGSGQMQRSNNGATNSETSNMDEQLLSDEALAWQLQEMDDISVEEALARQLQEMDDLSMEEPPNAHTAPSHVSPFTSSLDVDESSIGNDGGEAAVLDDDIDPDNMTYEERQALGELIGTEKKGLSDEEISGLRSKKYKSGIFSRKPKNKICVICQSTYEKGETLITLPCNHDYHKDCITQWLKMNRNCPVCKYEL